MKILIIIRTYPIDDYISYLCWQSWKRVLPNADFIFFAQDENDTPPGKYKWIHETRADILIRPYCCNFGGKSNVEACIKGLKAINTAPYNKVIFSDADITALNNPFDEAFEFGGVMQRENERHYSGQCLIFERWLFDWVVNYPKYDELYSDFIKNERSISDDTIFSWLATEWRIRKRNFHTLDYWRHEKLHHLEPDKL